MDPLETEFKAMYLAGHAEKKAGGRTWDKYTNNIVQAGTKWPDMSLNGVPEARNKDHTSGGPRLVRAIKAQWCTQGPHSAI